MGRKEMHPGSARKNSQRRVKDSGSSSANMAHQAKIRSLSAPVHIWSTTLARDAIPSNSNCDEFVCPATFFYPAPCTDRKCRRNHTICPLHEALPSLPSSPAPNSTKKNAASYAINTYTLVSSQKDVRSFSLPALATLQFVVAGNPPAKVYSPETGFTPPPSAPSPLPPPPPSSVASPHSHSEVVVVEPPFQVLPDDALLHLFLSYLPIHAYGLTAITCKSLFAQFLR